MVDCLHLIDAMRRDFSVELVNSSDTLREAQRLRYLVFCHERNVLSGRDGIETDKYDARSRHIVLRRRNNGELVGTARVITSAGNSRLPMQHVCDPGLLHGLPIATTGEVSRFALARDRHSPDGKSDLMLRLGLMQGVLRVSRQLGLTHWCAGMERSLLRLLRTAGLYFDPVGPLVEYHGWRQPAVAEIDPILRKGKRDRRPIWDYVTEFGELDRGFRPARLEAA